MRILLTSGASYAPPRGGATRSNLVWLGCLASAGHICRVVCPAQSPREAGAVEADGISIRRISDLPLRSSALGGEIREFEPDWVLVSSEDVSHVLLQEAERSAPGRVIYLAHTPQFFPFGPESWNPDASATRIIQRAGGAVAIGRHMAGYIDQHCGVKAAVIHPPIYGKPPFPNFGQFARGLILMINPCAVKGIDIFLELARGFPDQPFGALAGWGTTSADLSALEALPNVRILPNVRDIDDILSQARLLLMPSIWYEGFGLIVMEAMLRGLPVISSDSGGLMEAKQGTGFVIPVKPVKRYESVFDEQRMPRPVTAEQDLARWREALHTLLTDEAAYRQESALSGLAAFTFVSQLQANDFERFLVSLPPSRLTPDKRELLLKRIRQLSSS